MKLSKILLQTIVVGLAAGTISSCELQDQLETKDAQPQETIDERMPDDHNTNSGEVDPNNCPACGMG